MRKLLSTLSLFAAAMCFGKDIYVNSPSTTLLLKAEQGQPLHVSYYGERVDDAQQVYRAYSLWEEAYPAFARLRTVRSPFCPAARFTSSRAIR